MLTRIRPLLAALALLLPALQAQSPRALEVLHQRLLPIFEVAGVVYTDADEATGRLKVAVLDRGVEPVVREKLPALGILSRLVDVVESEPIVQLATLQSEVRPLVGGLQIHFSSYLCTLGFPAIRGGVTGFVTNSHCSGKQGVLDGMTYYQPLRTTSPLPIGTEIADPAYFKNGACPRGKQCRYSDSIFAQGASGVDFKLGYIATTNAPNTGSLTITGDTRINAAATVSTIGATVNKVGRTTGWTQGTVTAVGANVAVSGSKFVLLDQTIVENTKAVIVQGGDSGSNVWVQNPSGAVDLVGILWGGNTSGTLFVFSPFVNIERELGPLTIR